VFERIVKAIKHPILAIRHLSFVSRRALDLLILRPITSGRLWLFDRMNGIETRTIVRHEKLDCVGSPYFDNATYYVGCPLSTLKMAIRHAAKNYNGVSLFIDVGCGEGRACFFAARYFDKIVGIDFSPALVEAAKINRRNFTGDGRKIEFLLENAATFRLPEARCALFVFNPFDEVVMGRFLQLNDEHFRSHNSIIIYVSDVCSELLLRTGFVRSHKFTRGPKEVSIYAVGPRTVLAEPVSFKSPAILRD
jgi:SAM-dependent methyltransferase